MKPIDASGDQMLVVPDESIRDAIDTADCGNDPQLVADSSPSIFPAITHEGSGLHIGFGIDHMPVFVFCRLRQAGLHVVHVDPSSGCYVLSGYADRIAILYDRLSLADFTQRDFMSPDNVIRRCQADSGN